MSSHDDHGFVDISANGIERGHRQIDRRTPGCLFSNDDGMALRRHACVGHRPSHQFLTAVTETHVGELSI